MAVAFRSVAVGNSGAATSTTQALSNPTGMANGDGLVAVITADGGSGRTITPPSGWTLVGVQNNQSTNVAQWVYIKVAASEPGSWTWTINATAAISGCVAAYTGVDQTNPLSFFSQTTAAPSSTTVAFANYNPHTEADFLVALGSTRNTTAARTVTTPSSGFTKRGDTSNTATAFCGSFLLDGASTSLPVVLQAVGSTTMSAAVLQDCTTTLGLRAAVTATNIDIEVAMVKTAAGAASVVSDTFSTGVANTGVLVMSQVDAITTTTQAISTTTGLTFTLVASQNDGVGSGSVYVWKAIAVGTISGTVTVTDSTGTSNFQLDVYTFRNVDTTTFVGASNSAAGGPSAPTASLTTTVNNSWVWGAMFNNTATPGTVTAGQTKIASTVFSGTIAENQRQTAKTSTSGTSVAISDSAPTTGFWALVLFELLPPTATTTATSSTLMMMGI